MIDIAKARALCEAAHALECSSFKLLDFAVAARDGWAEAIDEVERLHGCANETILALKAERDAIKAELDTLKERLTYGPAKAFAEIDALKAEVERLKEVVAVRSGSWMNTADALSEVDDRLKASEAENARFRTVVDAAKEIVHCTDCDLEGDGHMTRLVRAVRALAAPQTGGDDV